MCDSCRAKLFCLREPFVNRGDVILWRKFRFLRVNGTDPIGERFLSGNLPAQARVVEMTMRVNQARQENLLAKIDNLLAGIPCGDFGKFSDIDNSISENCDRAILNRRSIHRHDNAGANDYSPFTTFRHAATKRLHGSWQRSGTVSGLAFSAGLPAGASAKAGALAKPDVHGSTGAWT